MMVISRINMLSKQYLENQLRFWCLCGDHRERITIRSFQIMALDPSTRRLTCDMTPRQGPQHPPQPGLRLSCSYSRGRHRALTCEDGGRWGHSSRSSRVELHAGGGPWWGSPMSHVDFKKLQCHMSLSPIFYSVTCPMLLYVYHHVTCHYALYVTYVEFKKWPCHPVDFRDQEPL